VFAEHLGRGGLIHSACWDPVVQTNAQTAPREGRGSTSQSWEREFHDEGSEALEQVVRRCCGCPLPSSVQGQVGRGFEQPGLVEGVPAHGRGARTR